MICISKLMTKNISESLNVHMSKLGYRLTASEVGVFSRELCPPCPSLKSHLSSSPIAVYLRDYNNIPPIIIPLSVSSSCKNHGIYEYIIRTVYSSLLLMSVLVIPVPFSKESHKFVAHERHIERLKSLLLSTTTHTLAPSAPTIVYVEATSSTSISVYWESSKNDGGSPITGYVVEYRPTSNPSFETQVVPRDVFSASLDGLTPSTEYDVRVRGENAVGRSVPSATMRATTDGKLIESLLPCVCVD